MEDAAFRRDRLQQAVVQLKLRLTEVKTKEERLRRKPLYDQAAAERDKLAAEMKRVYPAAAAALADLIGRIEANDRMIEYLNSAVLPRGELTLDTAELVARGYASFSPGLTRRPSIVEELQLPALEHSPERPYDWPPSRQQFTRRVRRPDSCHLLRRLGGALCAQPTPPGLLAGPAGVRCSCSIGGSIAGPPVGCRKSSATVRLPAVPRVAPLKWFARTPSLKMQSGAPGGARGPRHWRLWRLILRA
jgi:hypothetical protein